MRAVWNGVVLAESDRTVVVEGNHYFPAESLRQEYFRPSATHTVCGWKGTASYYNIEVDGQVNRDAAWAALARDKKARDGKPRLVLLEAPGKPVTGVERPEAEVRAALNDLIAD